MHDLLRLDHCTVNLAECVVYRDAVRTPLTDREAALLAYLAARPREIVSRDELLAEVWDYDPKVLTRAVDLAVSRLRRKVEHDPSQPRHLVTVRGEGYRFDPSQAEPAPPVEAGTNVTPRLTTFVGRQAELDAIHDALGRSRLVTVQGPPGVGKTRLAARFAHDHARDWPGGAWFCDLTDARTPADIAGVVASALGVPRDGRLAETLARRPATLLVLDNFEQLVAHGDATVGAWARAAESVRLLVTSRERLRLEGEAVVVLQPLDGPTSVDLFVDRAPRPLVPEEGGREAVAAVVARLDHLPLAIELAAARLDVLSLQALDQRLEDRFALLRTRRRDRAPHQDTLEAAIWWSWEQLAPWEQRALAWCSLFRGGFPLEAAEAVVDLSAWPDAPHVLDVVHALWDKSLLSAHTVHGERRFGLLESVRAFADARLGDDEREPVERRHGSWAVRHVAALEQRLAGADSERVRARMALEIDNLRATWERWRYHDPSLAVRAVAAMYPVMHRRGPFDLWHRLCEEAAEAVPHIDPSLRPRVVRLRGGARLMVGDHTGSARDFERSEALARDLDDPEELARALHGRGELLRHQGRLEEAERLMHEAIEAARGLGRTEVTMLQSWGGVLHRLGRVEDSIEARYEALVLAERIGAEGSRHTCRHSLAASLLMAARLEEAEGLLVECLDYELAHGDTTNELMTVHDLGIIALERDEPERALELLQRAHVLVEALNAESFLPETVMTLGVAHHLMGDTQRARDCFRTALRGSVDMGHPPVAGYAAALHACVEALAGRPEQAAAAVERGQGWFARCEEPSAPQVLAAARGLHALATGDTAAAADHLAHARAPLPTGSVPMPYARLAAAWLDRALHPV